jgi:hypothetical protein
MMNLKINVEKIVSIQQNNHEMSFSNKYIMKYKIENTLWHV